MLLSFIEVQPLQKSTSKMEMLFLQRLFDKTQISIQWYLEIFNIITFPRIDNGQLPSNLMNLCRNSFYVCHWIIEIIEDCHSLVSTLPMCFFFGLLVIPECQELEMARGYVVVWEPLLFCPWMKWPSTCYMIFALVVLLCHSNFTSMASSLLIRIWICKQIGKQ
jgi:hypothetical protein